MRCRAGLALALLLLAVGPAASVQPDEVMRDPALEARARALSSGLRCLVCQNQSIDDSDAPLARDLRLLVRDQIAQGRSDGEVRAFLVERYGDFVLLRPPLGLRTILLWGGPLAIVLLGLAGLGLARRRGQRPAPLTADEEARIAALLEGRDQAAADAKSARATSSSI